MRYAIFSVAVSLDGSIASPGQPGDRRRETPFFPAFDHRIDLELIATRTFGSRVTYARHRRAG